MAFKIEFGIFQHLVNQSAFVDRAVFSLWGTRRARAFPHVELGPSRAIGGSKSLYGRLLPGKCSITGNPFELKYGKLQQYPNVPPFRLSVRSDRMPLSGTQVAAVANSLFRAGFRVRVSLVEFTFDVLNYPLSYFPHRLFTRARSIVELGHVGHGTLYAGKPRSSWQLRVYQKTESIVRVEYALRGAFLRAHGVERVEDILRLRDLNVWKLASFKEFDEEWLAAALNNVPNHWGKQMLSELPRRWPLRVLAAVLRGRCGIDPGGMLHRSEAQRLLGNMQDNMLW